MEKNLILLPTRSDGSQPAPKRPLILSIGGKRYQIRIDAKYHAGARPAGRNYFDRSTQASPQNSVASYALQPRPKVAI